MHFILPLFALATLASAAARIPKPYAVDTADTHRMLRKRATGPGQGAVEFAPLLQNSVVGVGIEKRHRRHHHHSSSKNRKGRQTNAKKTVKVNKAVAAADTLEDCDETTNATATASNSRTLAAPVSAVAATTSTDGDDLEDCDEEEEQASSAAAAATPAASSASSASASVSSATVKAVVAAAASSNNNSGKNDQTERTDNQKSAQAQASAAASPPATVKVSTGVSTQAGTGEVHSSGIATFFTQNNVAGACGTVHQDSDFIVALPTPTYNNGALCGKKIVVSDADTGKSTTATVADECPTCPNANSLDLSVDLFKFFYQDADTKGIFNVKWQLAG